MFEGDGTVSTMHDLIRELREDNATKIVLLVADGLGGLPMEKAGKPNSRLLELPISTVWFVMVPVAFPFLFFRVSPPEAAPATWGCLVTIHSSTASAVAFSKLWELTLQ
jgi:hypothetical protein